MPRNPSTPRWWILGLLFAATVINYLDRQALSILSSTLRQDLALTDADYANAISAFLLSYMVMYAVSGRIIDSIGVRLGVVLCVGWWSVASMLTGLAQGAKTLIGFRFLLGLGEPGIYPASLKVCGDWFPGRMRATAMGIISAGITVGALVAAPVIAWLTLTLGWRWAFIIPGGLGLCWIPVWWLLYRERPASAAPGPDSAEEKIIRASPARPWRQLLRDRRLLSLVLAKMVTDPVWYFYLFWLPDYLQRNRRLSLAEIGLYAWIPFAFADLGMIGGGMLSDYLIRRGWTPPRARIAVLLIVAGLSPFGCLVDFMPTTTGAIALTSAVVFLTATWLTNINTLAADLSSRAETASWMGMMGSGGSLGGFLFAQLLGFTIARFGYSGRFALAAVLHPIGILLVLASVRGKSELKAVAAS